jgi:hypothetical protein
MTFALFVIPEALSIKTIQSTTKNAYAASYLEAAIFRHHNRAKPIKEIHSIRQEIRHEIKAQNLLRTYSRMSMMLAII